MKLLELTLELENTLEKLKEHYLTNERPENKRDMVFFEYVREKTNPIFVKIDNWYEEASKFVQNREVHVHPSQIQSTEENYKLILLHSYYVDVRKKRYMELFQSIRYVFDLVRKDLDSNK